MMITPWASLIPWIILLPKSQRKEKICPINNWVWKGNYILEVIDYFGIKNKFQQLRIIIMLIALPCPYWMAISISIYLYCN